MPDHPYGHAQKRPFWSRSVVGEFQAESVTDAPRFRLGRTDRFMSAGSCFAANVRRYLDMGIRLHGHREATPAVAGIRRERVLRRVQRPVRQCVYGKADGPAAAAGPSVKSNRWRTTGSGRTGD